jgi:hypothetical protein
MVPTDRPLAETYDLVFVGIENAGRVVAPVSSVGGSVASSTDYDVLIVRSRAL